MLSQCHYYIGEKISDTGTRTQVARVKAEYPNQLDYIGLLLLKCATFALINLLQAQNRK